MYKLLIIDDDPKQINSIYGQVNWDLYNIKDISTATQGINLSEKIAETTPDIIIKNTTNATENLTKLFKQTKALNPSVQFIFIGTIKSTEHIKSIINTSSVSYVSTPIDLEEFEFAVKRAVELLEKEKSLTDMKKILSEGFDTFRENIIFRFLHSKHLSRDYFENTIHNLMLDTYNCFSLAIAEISDYNKDIYSIIEPTKNSISKKITICPIVDSPNKLIMVFMTASKDSNTFSAKVNDELIKISHIFADTYKTTPTIGLSLVCNTMDELPVLLKQANSALEHYKSMSVTGICVYEPKNFVKPNYEISEIKDALTLLLNDCSPKKINSFLKEYYPSNLHINYVKPLCTTIITTLQLILLEKNLDIKDLFGNSTIIYSKLDNFDAQYNAKQWLYNILNATAEMISDSSRNKYEKIVINIKHIIDENYRTISNIEQISDKINISTSYAKFIFKDQTNMTIFDYLVSKRMEVAEKLLSDPYIKIYEVADLVGYKSKAHFSETFRRFTGQTPKDYQKNFTV